MIQIYKPTLAMCSTRLNEELVLVMIQLSLSVQTQVTLWLTRHFSVRIDIGLLSCWQIISYRIFLINNVDLMRLFSLFVWIFLSLCWWCILGLSDPESFELVINLVVYLQSQQVLSIWEVYETLHFVGVKNTY